MGKLWHEEGFEQVEPGNPIQRTRTFEPDDVQNRTEDEMKARIEELAEKRAAFDPKTQFCGLRRIGSSYTVAEPYAFFDGATDDQRKLNYALIYLGGGLVGLVGMMMEYKLRRGAYLTGAIRGALFAPFSAYGFSKLYDWNTNRHKHKQNVLFHYALLKENQFPVIERKKFGEIIKDWTPHRSLHQLGEGNFKFW